MLSCKESQGEGCTDRYLAVSTLVGVPLVLCIYALQLQVQNACVVLLIACYT